MCRLFFAPLYFLLSRVSHHNDIIQNLQTKRTKFVHIEKLRKTGSHSVSSHLVQGASPGTTSHAIPGGSAQSPSTQNAELQHRTAIPSQLSFVEFDLKNEVTWLGEAIPPPIPIKIEPDPPPVPVDLESS